MTDIGELPDRPIPKIAIGVAVPAIESWLLVAERGDMRESSFDVLSESMFHVKRRLKQNKYGSDRLIPRQRAVENARSVAENTENLEQRFPIGFGALANDVRAWSEDRISSWYP